MTERITYLRYVSYGDLLWRMATGWQPVSDLGPTHGQWSVLCQWTETGDPE